MGQKPYQNSDPRATLHQHGHQEPTFKVEIGHWEPHRHFWWCLWHQESKIDYGVGKEGGLCGWLPFLLQMTTFPAVLPWILTWKTQMILWSIQYQVLYTGLNFLICLTQKILKKVWGDGSMVKSLSCKHRTWVWMPRSHIKAWHSSESYPESTASLHRHKHWQVLTHTLQPLLRALLQVAVPLRSALLNESLAEFYQDWFGCKIEIHWVAWVTMHVFYCFDAHSPLF